MKKYLGMFVALLALIVAGCIFEPARRDALATAAYNLTLQLVDNNGNIFSGTASGTTASYNATARVVDANGNVLSSLTNMTSVPAWARYYGNGSDGTGPASGAITSGEKDYTSWTCTGAITTGNGIGLVVRSQGTVAFNTGCTITPGTDNNPSGDIGGAGGSGGAGAANSVASLATTGSAVATLGTIQSAHFYSTGGGASTGGAGNAATAASAGIADFAFSMGPPFRPAGGGLGTAGGSSGGAFGNGGGAIVIIAPTITIASGVPFDTHGINGTASAANSTGAGGGGGGGDIWFLSQSFTDSGGVYKYGGGPGGAVTTPAVYAAGDGCNTSGCGTGAQLTVTGLTTGGLDATKITITAAGSGYNVAPSCVVAAGASGLTGSPACHFTVSGGAIASIVIDTAGSGGTLTTFTTSFIGGFGANGEYRQVLIQ